MNDLDTLRSALADRYEIHEELGAGAMARVFRAKDLKHDRDLALKVFRPELREALGGDRFLNEIEITAGLSHPHILPLFDSGDEGGMLYYVTVFVEGGTLRDRIQREHKLSVDDTVRITQLLSDALQFAHDRGVIHRDIKPENILFQGGQPMIADFGIALAIDRVGQDRLTQTGLSIGTASYMSPEQASGDMTLDGRSDQYALACVTYEMLAGEPPFTGPTQQSIIARRFIDPPPNIANHRPGVPAHVEAAVTRGLQTSPADRFGTIAEYGAAVQTPAHSTNAPARSDAPPDKSVAVLPFVNMSSDTENEYFSDGITEDLIQALGRIEGVRVVGRTSAFAFKGRQEDVRDIGRQLDVGAVLEGSVRKAGTQIRVSVKLVSTVNGFELWSERYDRKLDDIFTVQDELVRSIVTALHGQILDDVDTARTPWTDNVDAYDRYLQGRHQWHLRTETSLFRSVDILTEALDMDPKFAAAAAGLADSFLTIGLYGGAPPLDVMPKAMKAAERALAIDPTLPEALTARACIKAVHYWEWGAAEQDFRSAIDSDRQYPTAYQWYALNCLLPQGRFDEARQQLAVATRIDPLAPVIRVSAAAIAYYEHDFETAVHELTELVKSHPSLAVGQYFLGLALVGLEAYDDAIVALEAASAASRSPENAGALAYALAKSGDAQAASTQVEEMIAQSQDRYISPVLIAQVFVGLGETDEAFAWLERAVEGRATALAWLAVQPSMTPLRSDPRMKTVLAHLKLPNPS